jgi:hypothetical protein
MKVWNLPNARLPLIHFVVPTIASLVSAMQQSKEKIQIKGKSLLKKKVRKWLLDGILIEQER